ncbi:MAG TPA: dTDP-4-dehydrorhamnose reductase [Nocardioidaceae bacterium]|nr:dTDP-4-dehydrorhamnose reductase [Nocardioidaceae bacterium]
MRWLVTGANGMLGQDLMTLLADGGHETVGVDLPELDITDAGSVAAFFSDDGSFDVVVNCAAWTAVDDAEEHEAAALRVNETGPRLLAAESHLRGARIVQISTDYVFDGSATTPYAENAVASPASAYGRTKWAGEEAVRREHPDGHLVVRTAWLYGAHGSCFPKTIAKLARERGSLSVVDDQVGQPTWTADVAATVVALVEADAPAGTYHATSAGQTSWFGFAQAVVGAAGMDPSIVSPTDSASFVRPAPRPAYSVLGHEALAAVGVPEIGAWDERWAVAASSVLSDAEPGA